MEALRLPRPRPRAPTQGQKGVPLFCGPFLGAQAQIPCGHAAGRIRATVPGAKGSRRHRGPRVESTCFWALGQFTWGP